MVSPHKVTREAVKSMRKRLTILSMKFYRISTLELPPVVEIEQCTYLH